MPTGTCLIGQRGVSNSTVNIWTEFKASLSDGALSALLSWPEVKERISNESRLEDGRRIDDTAPVRYQSRTITLEMHIIASSFDDFLTKERALMHFLSDAPKGIKLELYGVYGLTYTNRLTFNLKYLSCTQFGVYNGTLGKFAVRFIEPTTTPTGAFLGNSNNEE